MVNKIIKKIILSIWRCKRSDTKPIYPKKEIADLYLSFLKRPVDELSTRITLNGGHYLIRYLDLYTILNSNPSGNDCVLYTRAEQELYRMLFDVPLKQVPLYINTHPEIAQWRLRIGI